MLNDITLWLGGPQAADNPEAYRNLPEIRRLLQEGHNAPRMLYFSIGLISPGANALYGGAAQ